MKKAMTILVSEDTAKKIRDAVYWAPGMTISQFIEDAVDTEISVKNYAIKDREGHTIKRGRPVKHE